MLYWIILKKIIIFLTEAVRGKGVAVIFLTEAMRGKGVVRHRCICAVAGDSRE